MGALVGRDDDVARVLAAIAGARVVTVTGPPGIGKTTLARRCLDVAGGTFEGGAWFCDLSAVVDARGIVEAIAASLPDLEGGAEGADLADALAAAGPTLLVLDNFEQLVASVGFVQGLSAAAPELVLLVTSRARLAIDGERVVELAPLACPSADASDDDVLASDAVRLLVARASAAGGDVGADARVLGALVRRLDGIPLAIELAAARTRVLGVADLVARLDRPGAGGASGDPLGRLAAAIEWSWNLLGAAEQRALAACSVFAGEFSVGAAEAVIGASPGDPPALDMLATLRDQSLVHSAGDGRLALYVSIRTFAAARLDEGDPDEAARVRLRHASYYARAARAFAEARTFQGGPDAALRAALGRDRANLAAALAFVRGAGGPADLAAELALGLSLLQAAPVEVCLDALGEALDALDARPDRDASLVARIRLSRHGLLGSVGRYAESRADLDALLAMPDLAAPLRLLARVMQGIQLRYQGRARDAWASHAQAEAEIDDAASPRLRAMNLACMGRLGHEVGDADAARRYNARARAVAAEIGDAWLEGLPLANLAQLEQEHGRFDEAARLLEDALARFERTDEGHYVAVYSIAYGDLELERGRPDEARKRYASASAFFTGWHAHRQAVLLHGAWAALEARWGALDDAEMRLERARRSAARSTSALLGLVLDVHAAHLELRRAASSPAALAATRAALSARRAAWSSSEIAATSFDARFALRILGQSLDGATTAAPRAAAKVVVARDGAWFVAEKRVDLGRRGSLRRILAALVDARADGRGVARDALLSHGWPGERLLHDAASKRLRVAVATLRSLGLRDVIVTRDDGYAIEARAPIEVSEI